MTEPKSVGRYISIIHRYFHSYLHQELRSCGIGSGPFPFLMRLYKEDGITQETLAEELKTDKATSARAIHKLEDLGLVKRQRDPTDRRCYRIHLTPQAEKLRATCKTILRTWTDQLLNGFSPEEKDHLFTYLERIARNASQDQPTE